MNRRLGVQWTGKDQRLYPVGAVIANQQLTVAALIVAQLSP